MLERNVENLRLCATKKRRIRRSHLNNPTINHFRDDIVQTCVLLSLSLAHFLLFLFLSCSLQNKLKKEDAFSRLNV